MSGSLSVTVSASMVGVLRSGVGMSARARTGNKGMTEGGVTTMLDAAAADLNNGTSGTLNTGPPTFGPNLDKISAKYPNDEMVMSLQSTLNLRLSIQEYSQ